MSRLIRLMLVEPEHWHSILCQRVLLPGIRPRCYIYGTLNPMTVRHMAALEHYASTKITPTPWEPDYRLGPDPWARFLQEQPGNAVLLAGRNDTKLQQMGLCVQQALPVIADLPWILDLDDLPKLEQLYREADLREVPILDLAPARFDVVSLLQRSLVRDPAIFGQWSAGTIDNPALILENTYYFKKPLAGQMIYRPVWWFDVRISGDGLTEGGVPMADHALWLVAPETPIDYRRDIQVLDASRWPTVIGPDAFQELTQTRPYPENLHRHWIRSGAFQHYGNGTMTVAIRGVHTRITVLWDIEPASPGMPDDHACLARGTRSIISATRSNSVETALEITPLQETLSVHAAVARQCEQWQADIPGLTLQTERDRLRVIVPLNALRNYEVTLTQAMHEVVRQLQFPRSIPAYERSHQLAKHYIGLKATELARNKTGGI
ncbi:MAG: putative oxidoreductase C-terminal domain-containing protein [Gemmataceae bacterium]